MLSFWQKVSFYFFVSFFFSRELRSAKDGKVKRAAAVQSITTSSQHAISVIFRFLAKLVYFFAFSVSYM